MGNLRAGQSSVEMGCPISIGFYLSCFSSLIFPSSLFSPPMLCLFGSCRLNWPMEVDEHDLDLALPNQPKPRFCDDHRVSRLL